ncbi:hypothetical protein JAAARDRAFT_110941, partial [Jaapia argillacea MUCL 33604]
WHTAAPEAQKKMFAIFACSGIFVAVCRHSHLLTMCDMVRSGELMKCPLAICNKMLEVYGSDLCLGYDIMCKFSKTIAGSSIGPQAKELCLAGVVPAFHGYVHNRGCQVNWHPLYVDGVGIEDFEECEQTFAQSNHLASCTRLTSLFHRHQQIEQHFAFHD